MTPFTQALSGRSNKTSAITGWAHWLVLSLQLLTCATAAERQVVRGHLPVMAARLQPVGRLSAATRLNLSISLPLRDQEALTDLLERLYDPSSPQYRQYLTPEQFTDRFGPRREDYEALLAFARAQGLAVTATHPNRTLLSVSGSVKEIERAFHVGLQLYQHPTEPRTFHAPDVEPSLNLAIPVLHISGLDDISRPRPAAHRIPWDHHARPMALTGSGPGGGFLGNDFRAAYLPGVALDGIGQSVALLEFDGYYASDIKDYETLAGLANVPLTNVLINGFSGNPGPDNAEVALDIEMAIAMAPGLSRVIVYEGTYPWNDILNRIATDNLSKQISSSWLFSADATTDQIFRQYAAQGQSLFQAAGDSDAYSSSDLTTAAGIASLVDNPFVTCVGGTSLSTSGPGGSWGSETVWNLGYNLGEASSVGSSGGISPTFLIPSWQQGIDMMANGGSTVWRNLPDVAMVADNIWSIADNGDAYAIWGTSAAAPLWAGFAALANQLSEAYGQPPVGFMNPALYALGQGATYAALFHDITVGDNRGSSNPGFPAVPGYDLCTGWGSPDGTNLLYALALPQRLQIAPGVNFTASGPAGGPFTPAVETYALINSGVVALDWTATCDASWLDISANRGTLAPGSPKATVTLSMNSAANSLPAGSYVGNVWFTNVNDASVQQRRVTLAVVTPPVITTGPFAFGVPEGTTVAFTVVTATNALLFYTWSRDGTPLTNDARISGSSTSTLSISNVSSADNGMYTVLVTNVAGAAFSSGSLRAFPSAPAIVAPLTNQAVLPGATATFVVSAVGSQPLSYEWRKDGVALAGVGDSSALTLRNVSSSDTGTYSVIVSNILGSVTNAPAMLALIADTLPGVQLATLYSFTGGIDGANPNGLIQATNGLLYGTANAGGANQAGTVFQISSNGALTTLYTFSGGSDGAAPKAGLIQAADGNFYGTTYSGHSTIYFGGTVFRMTAEGALTTLHQFTFGGTDGYSPFAGLVQTTGSTLFGTTFSGGNGGSGAVFKMAPNVAVTTLHAFSGADGANPRAGLALGRDGNFYGVTKGGGNNPDHGTLFKIAATGAFTTLFEFDGTNGFSPRGGLVQGRDGNFYGTTLNGGTYGLGTIFRFTTNGALTTLHSFNGARDGYWPQAALVEGQDGYFYGGTTFGGAGFSGSEFGAQGTIFRMAPDGQFTTLVYFDGFNGANPVAPLVMAANGRLYGTTINGGASGNGTVFSLSVSEPCLTISASGGAVALSWPSWGSNLFLQETLDLAAGNWTTVTNQPTLTNLFNQLVLPQRANGSAFYRLGH